MHRLAAFKTALAAMAGLHTRYPDDPALNSIIVQLDYLVELETGQRDDRERLNDITIGVLAVREVEPLDREIAEVLYNAVEQVENMKNQSKSQN